MVEDAAFDFAKQIRKTNRTKQKMYLQFRETNQKTDCTGQNSFLKCREEEIVAQNLENKHRCNPTSFTDCLSIRRLGDGRLTTN